MSRVSAMFSGFIVAYMLREGGVSGVFGLITAAMVVVIVVIATFGPNVRGKPLDRLDRQDRSWALPKDRSRHGYLSRGLSSLSRGQDRHA